MFEVIINIKDTINIKMVIDDILIMYFIFFLDYFHHLFLTRPSYENHSF